MSQQPNHITRALIYLLIFQFVTAPLLAETNPEVKKKKRNFFWPPIYSVFVPGLDQWIKKEWPYAISYSGVAVAGYGVYALATRPSDTSRGLKIDSKLDRDRFRLLGLHMAFTSGLLSARHAFRYAVDTRPEDFPFLEAKETDLDLLKAPIQFEFLLRPTTFIPLLLLGGLIAYEVNHDKNLRGVAPTGSDYAFAGQFSYGAGTGEEAFFRGYVMPTTMYYWNSPLGANAVQASLFALGHGISSAIWQHFLFGLYTGWLSQHRGWSLAEGIFLHTWWDVFAFLAVYSFREPGREASFILTPLSFRF